MYLKRTLENYAKIAASQFPALLVTGARQVGKTTLLRHISEPERSYVSLDDPLILSLAKRDPALFFQRYRPPLLIDEIQYAPELLPYIKMESDNLGKTNLFWLTGSQQFHLMKGVSESLAGRVAIVQLLGFSRREKMGLSDQSNPFLPVDLPSPEPITLQDLYRTIWRGSYPAMVANDKLNRDLFYSSYIQTYLQRDVRDLARVGDELAFLRFLRIAAARTGQILNLSEFARDADISVNTAKSWLSIMEASGIIYLLRPYHSNVSKRLIKSPKIYFMDTGLCAYLTEWTDSKTLEAGAFSGAILETWVITELLKSYLHQGKQPPFYYYRDSDKKEIDLLIVTNGTIYPLEIKKTASPSLPDIRSFSVLEKLGMPIGPGGVICLCPKIIPLKESINMIPIGVL